MDAPLVWIIPVLNGMPYLPQALESIRSQTAGAFPVYVWDNGSTDGTLEVLREWIPRRLPGKIFTGEPLSLGNSLRRLGELADAPLVARMDADDICEPQRLEVQMRFMNAHPEFGLVASDRTCMDALGNEVEPRSSYPFEPQDILHATLRAPRLLHPSVIFRREALIDAGNYRDLSSPECAYWSEDYDMWLRALARHQAIALREKLLRYRYNPQGLTENEVRLKRAAIARRAAWQANAADFAGLTSKDTATRLWDRQLWFALPALNQIARHFTKRDGISPRRRWASASFRKAVSSFVRREDLVTRTWLRLTAKTEAES